MSPNMRPCPECSRVISAQGLPNHLRFVHKAPLGTAPNPANTSQGEGGVSPVVVLLLVVAAVAVVVLVATYTLRRCPKCGRVSVVKRDSIPGACPNCQVAIP
jgi:hypothetical protein